jgi:chromate transporter
LKAALAAVTAAVVGVILNLTVWFALNVLFRKFDTLSAGPLHLTVPQWASVDVRAVALSALAFALLFALHRGIITSLAICGGLAVAWFLAAGG